MFFTCKTYKNTETDEDIILHHKEKINSILKSLHQKIEPILNNFSLKYECLCEGSSEQNKAAFTEWIPVST